MSPGTTTAFSDTMLRCEALGQVGGDGCRGTGDGGRGTGDDTDNDTPTKKNQPRKYRAYQILT